MEKFLGTGFADLPQSNNVFPDLDKETIEMMVAIIIRAMIESSRAGYGNEDEDNEEMILRKGILMTMIFIEI